MLDRHEEAHVMIANLIVASIMVALTVIIHFFGLVGLMSFFSRRAHRFGGDVHVVRQGVLIVSVVLGLFAVHAIEIWAYAVLYRGLGEFSSMEEALYFSTSTFTTVGFGEIVLDARWRLLSAIESANGFLLIGWSTAFLLSVTMRLRALEVVWAGRREEAKANDEADDEAKEAATLLNDGKDG